MKSVNNDKIAYLFITPFFLIFGYFYFIPIFKVIADSFTDYDMFTKRNYVGFENYISLLTDERFIRSIANTVLYSIGTLLPSMIIGLMIALAANNAIIKTNLSRMFIFMPHVISMVAVSMIWLYLYEPNIGVFNTILTSLGFNRSSFLFDIETSLLSLIVMGVWKAVGYNMIVFLSGLKGIPLQYYEAAKIDGAGPIKIFFRITVPMLSNTTAFLFITGVIASFNVFEQVNIMTDGGPLNSTTTMVHQIYTTGFTEYKLGYASSMSVILLVIVIIVTLINFKLSKSQND